MSSLDDIMNSYPRHSSSDSFKIMVQGMIDGYSKIRNTTSKVESEFEALIMDMPEDKYRELLLENLKQVNLDMEQSIELLEKLKLLDY